MVEEGPSGPGMNGPMMYWGAYEGACGAITSWTEHGDMVYNHHRCLRGLMLLVLPNGGAHVVVY